MVLYNKSRHLQGRRVQEQRRPRAAHPAENEKYNYDNAGNVTKLTYANILDTLKLAVPPINTPNINSSLVLEVMQRNQGLEIGTILSITALSGTLIFLAILV